MPTTSRIRGRTPLSARRATSSWSAPRAAEGPLLEHGGGRALREAPQVVAEARGNRPQAPLSRRWTKPRTSRTPSSNASHGLRSRQWAPPGRRTWPPAIVQRRDAPRRRREPAGGPSAWRIDRRSAAAIGAARRSPSTRSRIAASADSWRGVWRSSSSSASDSPPSRTGNRSRRNARASAVVAVEGQAQVVRVQRRLALLAAAQLVAADRAAVVLADGLGADGPPVSSSASVDQVTSSRVTGRSQVAQRLANRSVIEVLRLDSRRAEAARAWTAASRWRRSGGRRTISARSRSSAVPSRLTPCAGRRSRRGRPSRRARTGRARCRRGRRRVDPGGDQRGRRRGRESLEGRQAEAGFGPQEERSPSHRRIVADVPCVSPRRRGRQAGAPGAGRPTAPRARPSPRRTPRRWSRQAAARGRGSRSPRPRCRPRGRPRAPRPRGRACPGVRPEVGGLGRGREADLAVVARVLEDLADDQAHVAVAQRGDAGEVLVAVGDELEQPGRDAGLDDADPGAVADRDQAVALGHELDEVARVHLGQLGGAGEVGQVGEAGLAGLLDEDADRGLGSRPGRDGRSPASTSSTLSRSMLRSAMRLVGSSARAFW